MKKNIVVNLIIFLFCFFHLIEMILFENENLSIIPIIQYVLIVCVTLFSIYINNKWDAEEKEFLDFFNLIIVVKLVFYICLILIALIGNMYLKNEEKLSIFDMLGISIFNIFDTNNENIIGLIGDYNNFFHTPHMGFRYFHRTIRGQFCMGQTYLLLLIAYDLFIKNRIIKLEKQDIFYSSGKFD